ncbi:MAG: hypothetical protein WCL51_15350, partial [Bacteroidota bacterium]
MPKVKKKVLEVLAILTVLEVKNNIKKKCLKFEVLKMPKIKKKVLEVLAILTVLEVENNIKKKCLK